MSLRVLSLAAALVVAAPLGASISTATPPATATTAAAAAAANNGSAAVEITPDEAARLAKQASFGPSLRLIEQITSAKTVDRWLENQFALKVSTYEDIAETPPPSGGCSALSGEMLAVCTRRHASAIPVQMRFYSNALANDDQLRQRVAFALSKILVASEVEIHSTSGLARFNEIFLSNAFGNYRDILKATTLNPFMGAYLNMADSRKGQPNENYARELMQLFSIGTVLLNMDGTPQLDSSGSVIPAYSNDDVKEVARALTGWTYARLNNAPFTDNVNKDLSRSMVQYPLNFDAGAKSFLGRAVSANSSQDANIDAVIDAVFNHPNAAPFVSKRLIQQLTVASPSPAYVGRVAAAFANNGVGVRGDMKTVVRAIFLDPEARTMSPSPGNVKEPILLTTSVARAIGLKSDGWAFLSRNADMGQAPFRAPSVFGFYPSVYPLSTSQGVSSPASKLLTTSTIVARHNLVYDMTVSGDPGRADYQIQPDFGTIGTVPDWASWEAYGSDDGKILDRINLVLLNGTMTSAQRQSLLAAMAQIKNSDAKAQTRKRAQMALYVVASSPLFQVDR